MININMIENKLPTCQQNDFHYEFTECDKYGKRWRVSVPEPNTCIGGEPRPPERGKDCMFSCPPGYFLDLQTDQECHPCAAGTYSLGGGNRFDQWDTLPQGFKATSEKPDSHEAEVSEFLKYNCSKSIWKPMGKFVSSLPNLCVASLYYSVRLVKPGKLTFEYQYDNIDTFFNYMVMNDRCENVQGSKTRWLDITDQGEWHEEEVPLKTGDNTIIWRSAGLNDMASVSQGIMIRSIQVEGIAYTSQCTSCPAGFFSTNGSQECTPCPVDHYSNKGSSLCFPCPPNQFSARGDTECKNRPSCTSADYAQSYGPCDMNTIKRTVTYQWIQPKICSESLSNSAHMPPDLTVDCKPCSPGQYYKIATPSVVNNNSHPLSLYNSTTLVKNVYATDTATCHFCPPGTFSDGTSLQSSKDCKKCPSGSFPNYGYFYTSWFSMPRNLMSFCYTILGNCLNFEGWYPNGTHLVTTLPRSNSYQGSRDEHTPLNYFYILALDRLSAVRPPYGIISFEFEILCDSPCFFYFVKVNNRRQTQVIKKWTSPSSESVSSEQTLSYKYIIDSTSDNKDRSENGIFGYLRTSFNTLPTYRWIFQRPTGRDGVNDRAIIYSINITNIQLAQKVDSSSHGGADSCLPCMLLDPNYFNSSPTETDMIDIQDSECIPCPTGTFPSALVHSNLLATATTSTLNSTNQTCQRCPGNTKLDLSILVDKKTDPCVPCGPGTISEVNGSGLFCFSDCRYVAFGDNNGTRRYDFTPLSGVHTIISEALFTAGGTQYFYAFNLSLCGSDATAKCTNNATSQLISPNNLANATIPFLDEDMIISPVCRSTIIPTRSYQSSNTDPDQPQQMDPGLNTGGGVRSAQAVSLGDELVAMGTVKDVPLIATHLKEKLNYTTLSPPNTQRKKVEGVINDIHFLYRASSPTMACPLGRTTVISLICDNAALMNAQTGHLIPEDVDSSKNSKTKHSAYSIGKLVPPDKCKLGTCDGCNFRFIWTSPYACPVCGPSDIRVMKGECVKGNQITYYYPAQYCIPPISSNRSLPFTRSAACSTVPVHIQMVIFVSAVTGILLCLIVLLMWKRTKKLEYKYMALVQQASHPYECFDNDTGLKNEAEFLGVDSCAIVEGEDYDEEEDERDKRRHDSKRGLLSAPSLGGKVDVKLVIKKLKQSFSGGDRKWSVNKSFNDGATFENITLEAQVPLNHSYRSTDDYPDNGVKKISSDNLASLNVEHNGTHVITHSPALKSQSSDHHQPLV